MKVLARVVPLAMRIAALAVVATAGISTPSLADIGIVRAVVTREGFIVGVGGGSGTLIFRGRSYPLAISGMSFGGTIGVSTTNLKGHA